MTNKLDPRPTLLSPFEYRKFVYGKDSVIHPKVDDTIEVNFENTLLEIFVGERSNLIFKQRITEDEICFYIEDQTESVNIKYLLAQLLFAAKKLNKLDSIQTYEQLCDEMREEQFDIPTPETLKRLQADESNSAYFNKPMSEIFLKLHKGDFYPYFDRSLIDKAGLKTEDATEKGFYLLKFPDGSKLNIEG